VTHDDRFRSKRLWIQSGADRESTPHRQTSIQANSKGLHHMALQSRPLEGVRVVDMTVVMAAPSATMFLADLGADVLKVENVTGGDFTRASQPYLFEVVNRNKRSVAVDFTTESGRELLQRLIGTADVLVQGLRPGALVARGFGPEEMMRQYPRLIYASLSAFGQRGPGAERRGVDAVVQAESGMAWIMGQVNHRLGLVDASAGIALSQAILAALFKRERDGLGDLVEISLLDTALWLQMFEYAAFGATGQVPVTAASMRTFFPTSGHYEVRDGRVYLAANQEKEWPVLCDLIGQPELTDDPRFATRALRVQHAEALHEILSIYFLGTTLDEVMNEAKLRSMMVSPILDYPAVVSHPQVAANDSLRSVTSARGEPITQVRAPGRLRSEAEGVYRPAPELGADTASVVRELGYSDEQVAQMVGDGTLRAI
jgi:crotonobetainyl-CoA:carnitine CoA-transferase CaiB-like acyl-CoA transferase